MTTLPWQGFVLTGAVLVSLLVNRQLLGNRLEPPPPTLAVTDVTAQSGPFATSPARSGATNPELASAAVSVSQHTNSRLSLPPAVSVASAFVVEIGNPYPLFAVEPLRRWPLASITKLMTALVAKESMEADREVTITETDIATDGGSGTFASGERFTVSDLIAAMLSASSNNGAEAVARAYGRVAFLAKMNEMAARLSLARTTFSDPTGLSVLNQTTAADVARLVDALARAHPDLLAITRKKTVTITDLAHGKVRTLATTNRFAGEATFIGGKTGYTDEASGNLVSVFRVSGRDIIIVVLGTADRFAQTKLLLDWVRETRNY